MESRADRLGYCLDGRTRWLAVPCNKSLETVCLGLDLLGEKSGPVPVLPLQIFGGRFGHSLQTCRLLWSYLSVFYKAADENGPRMRYLSGATRREMLGLVALVQVIGAKLDLPIDSVVTTSDASEKGLGVSQSTGLSRRGLAMKSACAQGEASAI